MRKKDFLNSRIPEITVFSLCYSQDERDKTVHSFSDSDSKDSLSNTGNNGKKKKIRNGNKMLR